mmetsp:Transcript_34986/g.65313  ORF Transcript_34986/g.65313 Transcript_34986/m.65313 type:complete len:330 (+) Transcript_34986:22-1011(+)
MSYNPFDDLPSEVTKEAVVDDSSTEPACKRQKLDGNVGMVSVDVAESKEENNKEGKPIKSENPAQANIIDVSSTLQTLKKHISNVKKQPKVLQLLFNLAEAELSSNGHAADFFQALQEFVSLDSQRDASQNSSSTPLAVTAPTSLSIASKLIDFFISRKDCFSSQEVFEIQNWYLVYSVRNSLCCDDSFKFSKACQMVSELFDCSSMFPVTVTVDYSQEGEDGTPTTDDSAPTAVLKRDRVTATLQCLRAAQPLYTRALWAKQPLDKLVAIVVQRRLQLDPDQREQLDDLSTSFALAKRKAVSGKPTQTVRAFNSTAHPLQTKKVGILR